MVDDLESQAETRRSGGMETVLQSLSRAVNYSISVRARTAAGAGPPSEPVYCTTHEDSKYFSELWLVFLLTHIHTFDPKRVQRESDTYHVVCKKL